MGSINAMITTTDTQQQDFVIVTNSPGELSSWVRSTTRSLKSLKPQSRIIIILVPCPYATGREKDIANSFPDVDIVLSPSEYLKICLGLQKKSFTPSEKGIVLFLGGDLWHALWIARKLKYPAVAYAAKKSSWSKYFELLFVTDDRTRQSFVNFGIPVEKIEVVGNLMLDGVKANTEKKDALSLWGFNPENLTIGLFPGSRLSHVRESLPIFLKVAEELNEYLPHIQFLLSISPYIHISDVEKCLSNPSFRGIEGSTGSLHLKNGSKEIITKHGTKIVLLENCPYDVINASDLILTIPGTNTAEIAALGKPMIVSFSWRSRIPRGGLGYFLNFMPCVWSLRRTLMHIAYKKIKFKALPNQWAQREIVPEVKLEKKAEELTSVALELLNDISRRERISRELLEVTGSQGAAFKIAQRIASL